MKVILAFDSFKESISARQAVEAAARGVRAVLPSAEIIGLPLADGGEGTSDALCGFMGASLHTCTVHDARMRPVEASYGVSSDGSTAVMDMASAAGLPLLEEHLRNPMLTTTFGVGEMMLDAVGRGCRKILLGIGGSATNDGGIGMLAALGVRFTDADGRELEPVGRSLQKIENVDWSGLKIKPEIEVVCDVDNPLYGHNGAAYIYARQKGASEADVVFLDDGLRHFESKCSVSGETSGSGAAGGLGYGLLLLGAKLRRGVDVVLDYAMLDKHLQDADVLITGEGKTDRQTLCGKLPWGLLQHAKRAGVPVVVLAGMVEDRDELLAAGFADVRSINPPLNTLQEMTEAMKTENAMRNLCHAVNIQVSQVYKLRNLNY